MNARVRRREAGGARIQDGSADHWFLFINYLILLNMIGIILRLFRRICGCNFRGRARLRLDRRGRKDSISKGRRIQAVVSVSSNDDLEHAGITLKSRFCDFPTHRYCGRVMIYGSIRRRSKSRSIPRLCPSISGLSSPAWVRRGSTRC